MPTFLLLLATAELLVQNMQNTADFAPPLDVYELNVFSFRGLLTTRDSASGSRWGLCYALAMSSAVPLFISFLRLCLTHAD